MFLRSIGIVILLLPRRYAMVSAIGGTEGISLPLSWTPGDISDWLAMQVKDVLPDLSFDPEKDLFDQGLDR